MPRPKKTTVFTVLNAVGALLTGLLGLELYLALSPEPAAPMPAAPTTVSAGFSTNPPAAIAAWRAAVLDRPLFDPSRRPEAVVFQAASPVPMPRLSGIMITPTEKIAVFSPATGNPIIVAQDSQFGPFTVLSITPETVTVRGPDGVTVLASNFNSGTRSAASTPLKRVVPNGYSLADGFDLRLIKPPLPSAADWMGPPALN